MPWILCFAILTWSEPATVTMTKNTVLTFDQAWGAVLSASKGFEWKAKHLSEDEGRLAFETKGGASMQVSLIERNDLVIVEVEGRSDTESKRSLRRQIELFLKAFVDSL